MISTMYYYNISPYMSDKGINRKGKYTVKPNPYKSNKDITYFLNKSLNEDIKSYATDISKNLNTLKNIANNIYQKMYNGTSVEDMQESFEKFVSSYNGFAKFLKKNTGNSKGFEDLLEDTSDMIEENGEIFAKLGISMDEDGFLDISNFSKKDFKSINMEDAKNFYQNFYDKLCNFMKQPMSNHMNFKDFSYYFTYAGDYNTNKSFKLIEQGLLVDICL